MEIWANFSKIQIIQPLLIHAKIQDHDVEFSLLTRYLVISFTEEYFLIIIDMWMFSFDFNHNRFFWILLTLSISQTDKTLTNRQLSDSRFVKLYTSISQFVVVRRCLQTRAKIMFRKIAGFPIDRIGNKTYK